MALQQLNRKPLNSDCVCGKALKGVKCSRAFNLNRKQIAQRKYNKATHAAVTSFSALATAVVPEFALGAAPVELPGDDDDDEAAVPPSAAARPALSPMSEPG